MCENLDMKRNAVSVSIQSVVFLSCSFQWCKGNSDNPKPETEKSHVLVHIFKQVLKWWEERTLLCINALV